MRLSVFLCVPVLKGALRAFSVQRSVYCTYAMTMRLYTSMNSFTFLKLNMAIRSNSNHTGENSFSFFITPKTCEYCM